MIEIEKFKNALACFYAEDGNERVGFILEDKNKVIEVQNTAPEPEKGFMVAGEDIVSYTELNQSWATWHTHPGADSNLSGEDYRNFMMWPNHHHFIIGKDKVRCFKFDKNKKMVVEL